MTTTEDQKQICAWAAQEIEKARLAIAPYSTELQRSAYRMGLLQAAEITRKYARGEGAFQKRRHNQN